MNNRVIYTANNAAYLVLLYSVEKIVPKRTLLKNAAEALL